MKSGQKGLCFPLPPGLWLEGFGLGKAEPHTFKQLFHMFPKRNYSIFRLFVIDQGREVSALLRLLDEGNVLKSNAWENGVPKSPSGPCENQTYCVIPS